MKIRINEQIKLLAEFFKTLPFTNKTCIIQGLLNLQLSGLVRKRDVIVDKWPDPKNVLIRSSGKQNDTVKRKNSVFMWSCDLKNAAVLLKNEIDWSQEWRFDGILEDFLPLLDQLSRSFGGVFDNAPDGPSVYETHIMLNRPVINKSGSIPDHFQINSLRTSDAAFIDSHYALCDEYTLSESIYEIEHLPSVAIRNSNGELAAWGWIQEDGIIGQVQTMPQYRKKGLGRFVSRKLAEEAHNIGLIPLGSVDKNNQASRVMLESAGYSRIDGFLWWKMYTPPTAKKLQS